MGKSERLLSLDVFRGITIAGMILVNNPGTWDAIYPPLEHSKWNGCTPTDIIFPFFLFIVGVAIPFALDKRIGKGDNNKKIIIQITRRSIILFLLGIFIHSFPFGLFGTEFSLATVRIPGVLQRIAVVYFITSNLYLKTKNYKILIYAGVGILVLYWMIMTLILVPGVGYANLEPTTSFAAWLDRTLLGEHLWQQSKLWDPEGILSTFPAITTAILGILTGVWLKSDKDKITKTVWLFVAGCFCMAIGYIWNGWFPINKNLWTSSYVVYTGGLALLFLGICYWFIDVRNSRWWIKPFQVYGLNAITAYFLSELGSVILYLIKIPTGEGNVPLNSFLFNNLFLKFFTPINASLLWAIIYVIVWLGIAWILYTKKIFIKV
jgi:predicted acyltransferase